MICRAGMRRRDKCHLEPDAVGTIGFDASYRWLRRFGTDDQRLQEIKRPLAARCQLQCSAWCGAMLPRPKQALRRKNAGVGSELGLLALYFPRSRIHHMWHIYDVYVYVAGG